MASIRTAQPADDDVVVGVLLRSFGQLYAAMHVPMAPERATYLSDQASRRAFAACLVYEDHAGVVRGTVTLVAPSPLSEAWVKGAWDLRLLAVDPDAQGHGVARQLMAAAERHVRVNGGTTICLHARRGVSHQARFYRAAGYRRDTTGDLDISPPQEGYRKDLSNSAE